MSCYIETLQNRVKDLEKGLKKLRNSIYCIGGPLNDNKLKFNNKQLVWFVNMKNFIDVIL